MVVKGMPPMDKVKLIVSLQIVATIKQSSNSLQNEKFAKIMCQILSVSGLSVMEAIEKLSLPNEDSSALPSLHILLQEEVHLLFSFLSHPSPEVLTETEPFCSRLISFAKTSPDKKYLSLLPQLASRFVALVKYPEEYDPEDGEEEGEFLHVRSVFSRLLTSSGKCEMQVVANLFSSLTGALKDPKSTAPLDVELALHVLLIFGSLLWEKRKEPSKLQTLNELLRQLVHSEVLAVDHTLVKFALIDIFSRFEKILPSDEQSLARVLQMLVSQRAILSQEGRVRRRACYCFSRLVLTFSSKLESLVPHFATQLRDLLVVRTDDKYVHSDDQSFLFDAFGKLLSEIKDLSKQQLFMQQLAGPLLFQLHSLASDPTSHLSNMENFRDVASRLLEAVGTFSKGFRTKEEGAATHVKLFFKGGLDSVTLLLSRFVSDDQIRDKCVFYLHRMVELLREDVLPAVEQLTPVFFQKGKPQYMEDYLKWISQIVNRIKSKKLEPLLSKIIPTVLSTIIPLFGVENSPAVNSKTEEQREILELKKSYLGFVRAVVKSEFSSVLLSSKKTFPKKTNH